MDPKKEAALAPSHTYNVDARPDCSRGSAREAYLSFLIRWVDSLCDWLYIRMGACVWECVCARVRVWVRVCICREWKKSRLWQIAREVGQRKTTRLSEAQKLKCLNRKTWRERETDKVREKERLKGYKGIVIAYYKTTNNNVKHRSEQYQVCTMKPSCLKKLTSQ